MEFLSYQLSLVSRMPLWIQLIPTTTDQTLFCRTARRIPNGTRLQVVTGLEKILLETLFSSLLPWTICSDTCISLSTSI